MKERAPALTFKQVENKTSETEAQLEHRGVFIEGLTPREEATEFIEGRPEVVKAYAQREATLHKRFWPELSPENETHKEIQTILEDILERAGLPRDFLSLGIFDSNYPDVHIQLLAKQVRVSRSFLELVEGDLYKITSVLAHEVGHLLLAHFKSHGEDAPDPLDERIQGYEHEYQADRASTILTNRLGIPPSTLAETLTQIERDLYSRETADKELYPGFNYRSWVLSTHPHTARRVMAINRDSVSLPRYPKKIDAKKIPVPKKSDFPQVDSRTWDDVAGLERTHLEYVDCLWDEIPLPDLLGEYKAYRAKVHKKSPYISVFERQDEDAKQEQKLEKLFVRPSEVVGSPKPISKPLSSTPEDVISWTEENHGEVDEWWKQSLRLLDDKDGYQDLIEEVIQYPPRQVRQILAQSCPEYSAISNFEFDPYLNPEYGKGDKDEDVIKELGKNLLLTDVTSYDPSTEARIVTSVLIKSLFENDPELRTIKGMREFCTFLRNFHGEHGTHLAYDGARYFIRLEEMFDGVAGETEREQIAELAREYQAELTAGIEMGFPLAKNLMPKVCNFLDQKYPNQTFARLENTWDPQKTSRTYQLPMEVKEARNDEELTPEKIGGIIKNIPSNFRPTNLSVLLFSAAKSINEEIDREGYSDSVLEADINAQAAILSTDEFEEKYFGEGRLSYVKADYASIDEHVQEYQDMAILWNRAGYDKQFEALPSGLEKLRFLIETFRTRSAKRDVLIAEAVGWPKIKHVEDIMGIQEVLLKMEDIPLLFELTDVFSNPLLSLSVSQRLWELYQKDPDRFLSSIPPTEQSRVSAELDNLPENQRSRELQAILLCHKEPTYVRDELLRPLVDAAPDQTATMAIASWYCEPPPGVLRPRSGEVVAVTETLLDALRGTDQLDKQELFLYFLGHRTFYTGIDSKFFPHLRGKEKGFRQDAMFLGGKNFLGKHELRKRKKEPVREGATGKKVYVGLRGRESQLDPKYLMDSPDSLVFLTKVSGVPVELLLKQQRLTTTRREQRDFIDHLLLGNEGLLTQGNKAEFLSAVARNIVENSSWSEEQTDVERTATTDLLAFALNNCPDGRLPDLFLGLWNLQQEKESLPRIMTTLLRELGSLFIKAGQYLGTQSNALPKEWIQAFRGLSDQNTRAEKTLVYEHEHALYGDNSPFKRIGEKEGEGSMAAVYKGELKEGLSANGPEVVAKIFHPNIEEELAGDVLFLDKLVKFINSRREEFRVRLPDNLAEVSRGQILKELSYTNIVRNSADMTEVLRRSESHLAWKVPQILQAHSKPGFIVHQYAYGVPVDTLSPDNKPEVRGQIGLELLRQILVEGTYQGDPNVGNFKAVVPPSVGEKVLVNWLDTDHLGRFTKEEVKDLRSLVVELAVRHNPKTVSELLASFVEIPEINPLPVEEVEAWLKERNVLGTSSVEDIENVFTAFLDFLADHKLVLKEQYVTLLRALGLMKPLLADVKQEQILPFFAKLMLSR